MWRADGRELYYWNDGVLMAVQLDQAWGDAPPAIGARTVLFRAPYDVEPNTMYDASPDGKQFWISSRYDNHVMAIDTATGKVLARIPTDTEPHGLNYFPSSRGTRSLGHNGVYLLD